MFLHSQLLGLRHLSTGADRLVGGTGSQVNKLEGGLQNDFCQHQCLHGRMSSPKCCYQYFSFALCLSGRLFKISRYASPRSLSNYSFCLGHRVCDILCKPFKSGVYFLQPSHSPGSKSHQPSKPDLLEVYLPSAGFPGWGAQYGAWATGLLGRTSAVVIILSFWVTCLGEWVLTVPCTLSYTSCGSSLISLVIGNLFCQSSDIPHQQFLCKPL